MAACDGPISMPAPLVRLDGTFSVLTFRLHLLDGEMQTGARWWHPVNIPNAGPTACRTSMVPSADPTVPWVVRGRCPPLHDVLATRQRVF